MGLGLRLELGVRLELHSPTVPSESSVTEEATRLAAACKGGCKGV